MMAQRSGSIFASRLWLPSRKRATSPIGFWVADSPMRCSGCPVTCPSRSRLSARCDPRRESITAWISSTITVRTVRSIARLRSAVRSRYSDSGVVTRMCGGVRSIAARRELGVSPVRTAERMRTEGSPACTARSRMAPSGSSRFLWMSALSAFRGEM